MAIADESIRSNSIRFRDAVRSVHERVRAAAGDFDPPGETGEERALRELWEGPESERREQLHHATRSLIACGLLTGSLHAHFSDAMAATDIPGWAWECAGSQSHLWMFGCLILPALLPDEWQRWSGDAVFLDCGQFDAWLAMQNFAAPVPAQMPEAFDAADRPEPVRHYAPPERPFVTLSQALSWIAFGASFDNDRLIRAIDDLAFGPSAETEVGLKKAVADLTALASSNAIQIRGKYIESDSMDASVALTNVIDPIRFHDFAQFDICRDALRYGTGLTWTKSESIGHLMMSERSDSIRSVAVDRFALMRHFPSPRQAAGSELAPAVEAPFEWSDFGAESIPELERLHGLALRDEWWTWPEAIAWLGSRETRNIATLRYWAVWWESNGDADPTITIAAQADIARRFCTAPDCAKADLINAIERGAVATAGRSERHGKSEPLARGDWRGGTVIYSDGGAQLVSAKNQLVTWAFDIAVSRDDLVTAFPSSEANERVDLGLYSGGITYELEPLSGEPRAAKIRRKPGPKADPDWTDAIAVVTEECVAAGYQRPLERGQKAAICTMLLSKMADKDKHFSDDAAAKYATQVIAALSNNSG
jgi:hypothetical protein